MPLLGNRCGSYGLTLGEGGDLAALPSLSQVCHVNKIYSVANLQQGAKKFSCQKRTLDTTYTSNDSFHVQDGVVKLSLWWVKGSEKDLGALRAFFWVTMSGELPPPPPDPEINAGIVQLLVVLL